MDSEQQHYIMLEPVSMECSSQVSCVHPIYEDGDDYQLQMNEFKSDAALPCSETDSVSGRSIPSLESVRVSSESFVSRIIPIRHLSSSSESAIRPYRQPMKPRCCRSLQFSDPVVNSIDNYNQDSCQPYHGSYNNPLYHHHFGMTSCRLFPSVPTYGQTLALPSVNLATSLNQNKLVPSDGAVQKKILPFSIEAILAKDPAPKHIAVSSTVTESTESQDAYCCHICDDFCRDTFEANLHRQRHRQPMKPRCCRSLQFSDPVVNSIDNYNQDSCQPYHGSYNNPLYHHHFGMTSCRLFPSVPTYGQTLALPSVNLATSLNQNKLVPSDGAVQKKILPCSIEAILAKDPAPKHIAVSSTVTESTESQDAYWCHICDDFCRDAFEANLHRQRHRLENATPALQRDIFTKHGHVTKHLRQCYMNRVTCGVCRKTVMISSFKRHIASHNGFPCGHCGKEFYLKSRLQEHMLIHTGERPHSCSVCNRKFAKKSSLTQHMNYHTDNKKVQCEFCGKRFYRACALRVHIRNHTGEFPFKCELPECSKAFPQKIQLQLHMNAHRRKGDV